MSAAPSVAVDAASQRGVPRRPLSVPLDVIVLRSGIPESLPGRCTDMSEHGVGAIVAGALIPGQQVAIELRLPNMGVPVRSRALVRYQQRLRCGLQFVGLMPEQREMIRYWTSHASPRPAEQATTEPAAEAASSGAQRVRKIRIRVRRFYTLLVLALAVAALGWWQWTRSWKELETDAKVSSAYSAPLTVSPEIMSRNITFKSKPIYPEDARRAGVEGVVVLDAVIGADGRVRRLTPVKGPDLLVRSATAAVESWRFEPYLFDGKPRNVETTITVEFKLE
jgi:TonB family protein